MYFSCTYFHNFRNIMPDRMEWSPGFNLITGPNGAGKTNFLEALNLMSGWGPLERGTKIQALVKWRGSEREDRASLWGRARGEEEAEIFASISSRCSLKIGDRQTGASDMRLRVPVMSFLSGHTSLLKGGASHRRQLLDRIGALISPSYARRLTDYRQALRHKSALLRKGLDPGITDRILVRLGAWIWTAREEIVSMIGSRLKELSELIPHGADLELAFARGGGGRNPSQSSDFRISLEAERGRERAARISLVGPQRDDLRIKNGVRDACISMSRGQSSRTASALILASAAVVERSLGRKPVLIFDEIASELDMDGREAVFESLLATGYQVYGATTDAGDATGVTVYRIEDGRFL